jgi:hypothetical protein
MPSKREITRRLQLGSMGAIYLASNIDNASSAAELDQSFFDPIDQIVTRNHAVTSV